MSRHNYVYDVYYHGYTVDMYILMLLMFESSGALNLGSFVSSNSVL